MEKLYYKKDAVEYMTTLREILLHSNSCYGDRIAYIQTENKNERSQISFRDFYDNVEALRASFYNMNLGESHVAVWGESSWQWVCCYLALVSGTGTAVPVDKELDPESIALQLAFADADTLICSAKVLKKVLNVLPSCPGIKRIILMRSEDVSALPDTAEKLTLSALIEDGKRLISDGKFDPGSVQIDPDKMAMIIFTSGTTGANKGVMLSNRSVMGTLRGCARLLRYPEKSISVLPVHHCFELHAHLMSALYCGTTVYFNDDLKHLLKNLSEAKPEMSCMVPVMLDLLVKKIKASIRSLGKEKSFERAVKLSNALRRAGIDIRRRLFSGLVEPFGGNLKMIICGGAVLSQDTVDFFDSIGICIYNGYGITECSPVVAVNPGAKRVRNSVGHLLPTVMARVADPDEKGCGELQFKGDGVMLGYYKSPEDTKAVFTEDGWFRSADLGSIDENRYVYINGRLKNLIILPNGKNISPEEAEEHLIRRIPYISECVVYADKDDRGLCVMCYLDPGFCASNELHTAQEKLAYLRQDIQRYNCEVPGYKKIMDASIRESEFEKNTGGKILRYKIISE